MTKITIRYYTPNVIVHPNPKARWWKWWIPKIILVPEVKEATAEVNEDTSHADFKIDDFYKIIEMHVEKEE